MTVKFTAEKLIQMGEEKELMDGHRYQLIPKCETAYIADCEERREAAIGAWKRRWNIKGFLVHGLEAIKSRDSIHVR